MLHVISARCVACDLHTIAPGPLERAHWRQFTALWGDCKKTSNSAFECDYSSSHSLNIVYGTSLFSWKIQTSIRISPAVPLLLLPQPPDLQTFQFLPVALRPSHPLHNQQHCHHRWGLHQLLEGDEGHLSWEAGGDLPHPPRIWTVSKRMV